MNDKGVPFNVRNFTPFFYHMVDHSSFRGLNVTCHCLRIGGATIHHKNGMEIREVMRLGCWSDFTVNTYLREELLESPDELRKNRDYLSHRKHEQHFLCNCKKTTAVEKKAKHVKRVNHKRAQEIKNMLDTHKYKLLQRHQIRAAEQIERGQFEVPHNIKSLTRFMLTKARAVPHTDAYTPSSRWLKMHYNNNSRLFTVAVMMARRRWRSFLDTCKYNYYQRKFGGPGMNKLDLWHMRKAAIPVPNEDTLKAKRLLQEYDNYSANIPPMARKQWDNLTPAPHPWKLIPSHIHPSVKEIEAEKHYSQGELEAARCIMHQVRCHKNTD